MVDEVIDRRTEARFGGQVVGEMRTVLRPGCAVSLINLSAGGALIEGPRPLRPGARVHLVLGIGARSFGLAAHVLRCSVASLDATDGVRYRGALRFDERCDRLWERGTQGGYPMPGMDGGTETGRGQLLPTGTSAPKDNPSRAAE